MGFSVDKIWLDLAAGTQGLFISLVAFNDLIDRKKGKMELQSVVGGTFP